MRTYLHQLWLVIICLLLLAGLFLPIGQFANEEGATALLTNFRIRFVEGEVSGALWALGVLQALIFLVALFELLLSGFQNFVLQKRLLVFIVLMIIGYYILFVIYVIMLKGDASFRPQLAAGFPLIALILDIMTFYSVQKAEADIIAGSSSFRLRD